MTDFTGLGRAALEAMALGGDAFLECRRALARTGATVIAEALGGASRLEEWAHYPAGDVYDPRSHAQYFYHVHPPAAHSEREHGHFHAFLRPRGMPPGTRPLIMPELAIADAPAAPVAPPAPQPNQGADNDEISHLAAIAVDTAGEPVRLFTTNRWVTGETWYAAADVVAMLDRFTVGLAWPSPVLNRWITALFALFRPQLIELVRARDEAVMSFRRRRRGKVHVFEDRRLEITSAVDIDVEEQIRRVAQALRQVA
jgi:hypothetical protein